MFHGNSLVGKMLNQSEELKETVRTINHVHFKPYTETIVRGSWPNAYRSTDVVVLELITRSNNQ